MGMFDTVECDYRLPNPRHQNLEFQTKSLDPAMERYTITADGRLLKHPGGGVFEEEPEHPVLESDVELPIHGDIEIYQTWSPEGEREWAEYTVRFTHGRVEWIRPLERRGRPVPPRPSRAPGRRAPEGPPQPGLMGRRLSADEFTACTPEKLEHIDGQMPGDKAMLLLLLTSFGLRRTAALVGYDLWRRALPEDVATDDEPES